MGLGVGRAQEVAAGADLADGGDGLVEILEARAVAELPEHLHLLGVEHELGVGRGQARPRSSRRSA